jgi:hypothetical protein
MLGGYHWRGRFQGENDACDAAFCRRQGKDEDKYHLPSLETMNISKVNH